MTPVILLYVAATLEAVFTGEGAMGACLDLAATYEQPAMCVPPTSEAMPYLGMELQASIRPKARVME